MPEIDDGYDSYYANRLWELLPSVYRALDSDVPGVPGPLEELVTRIGSQVAVVRRSIDRLWANQSIETCDDWAVPYIGDLLGTTLVNDDPRGQRLEVAKTIHYRRRKGTVAVLEELARDVTGWQAHIVEAFRRLGRTRHRLDPPVGPGGLEAVLPKPCRGTGAAPDRSEVRRLLVHEGLAGVLTGTPAGGLADLRSLHGAQLTGSPFDEYFHTADVRAGHRTTGWYGIAKLLVFVWRLHSFPVVDGTPVAVAGASGEFAFDPTGRRGPLFLSPLGAEPDDWVDTWTSAAEWQVPGPVSDSLGAALADPGTGPPRHATYPGAAELPPFTSVLAGPLRDPVPVDVRPEAGTFTLSAEVRSPLTVSYQYGFPAPIGAGPYDRALETPPPATVGSDTEVTDGSGLHDALVASGGRGTVTIADSLTYAAVSDVGTTSAPMGAMLIRAGAGVRPVIRLPMATAPGATPTAWVFTGGGPDSELTVDGLLISGGDIVLRGGFAAVRLTACTADPGTLDEAADAYANAVDGRPLAPARVWIEADPEAQDERPATVASLIIDHCVLGPVRTRNGGAVEALTVSDTIIQGIAPVAPASGSLGPDDVHDPEGLIETLTSADPVAVLVDAALTEAGQVAATTAIRSYAGGPVSPGALASVVAGLNVIIGGPSLYSPQAFARVPLPPAVAAQVQSDSGQAGPALNRALLEAAFGTALSPAAVALAEGTVSLTGVTVLGRVFVHRLEASDTIMSDFTVVDDRQNGCVRFCAVAAGSAVPSPYQSAPLADGAALFTSRRFGEPAFGQLLETVDSAVDPQALVAGTRRPTIAAGAENGSEMGAFSGQLGPLKEERLLAKYREYMPLGLTPVVVHVT